MQMSSSAQVCVEKVESVFCAQLLLFCFCRMHLPLNCLACQREKDQIFTDGFQNFSCLTTAAADDALRSYLTVFEALIFLFSSENVKI